MHNNLSTTAANSLPFGLKLHTNRPRAEPFSRRDRGRRRIEGGGVRFGGGWGFWSGGGGRGLILIGGYRANQNLELYKNG